MKITSVFYQLLIGTLAMIPILASCDSDEVQVAKVDAIQQKMDIQTITPSVAIDMAAKFTNKKSGNIAGMISRSTLPVETIKDHKGNVIAYAINYEDGGWVVVGATKAYYPILAYSEEGQFAFEKSNQTTGLEIWVDEIGQAIESADSFDDETTSQIALEWLEYQSESLSASIGSDLPGGNSPEAVACRARLKELNETYYQDGWSFTTLSRVSVTLPSDVYSLADSHSSSYEYTIVGLRDIGTHNYVAPLMTTQWYQQSPYNGLCPNGSPAGCVPTAMAQIMKFHKYPSQFNWNDMPDAVATYSIQSLLKDIGTTIGATYMDDITVASYIDALNGFLHYGYSAELKDHVNDEVISYLSLERVPVYMRGTTGSYGIGHAWVCDGVIQDFTRYAYYVEFLVDGLYTNLNEYWMDYPRELDVLNVSRVQYHMNWGEKTASNGWYIDVKVNGNDFSWGRKNIYVKPKTN